ncbi:MAG: Maf family protein [Lachnospiraceae bacterium]|nr:Maf family protein [Lachnospiraceae bacterium]
MLLALQGREHRVITGVTLILRRNEDGSPERESLYLPQERDRSSIGAGAIQDSCIPVTSLDASGRKALSHKPQLEEENIPSQRICPMKGELHVLCRSFAEETRVEFYPLSQEEIREYISTGEPMDKAGSYAIQGRFAKHVKAIHGDYNNVVGLPISRLYREIREMTSNY